MSDAAIANIVTGLVTVTTIIAGVVTLWIKQRHTSDKLDENTRLTVVGTTKATAAAHEAKQAAKVAADTAATAVDEAKAAAQRMEKQLNGDLEERIRSVVKGEVGALVAEFHAHAEQDDKNMQEIRKALGELRDRTVPPPATS